MYQNLEIINKKIIKCRNCKRLVQFRKKISTEKRKQYLKETYWGKPITGFGDQNGKILFEQQWVPEGSKDFPWEKMPWE